MYSDHIQQCMVALLVVLLFICCEIRLNVMNNLKFFISLLRERF